MFYRVLAASLLASTITLTTPAAAEIIEADTSNQALYDWKNSKLNNPDSQTLKFEKEHDIVYIYSGMKVADINHAMDTQFHRVDYMMFTQELYPSRKSSTGYAVDDDGCN